MSFRLRALIRLLLETRMSYGEIAKELQLSPELVRSYDVWIAKAAPSDPSYLLNVSDAMLRRRLAKPRGRTWAA